MFRQHPCLAKHSSVFSDRESCMYACRKSRVCQLGLRQTTTCFRENLNDVQCYSGGTTQSRPVLGCVKYVGSRCRIHAVVTTASRLRIRKSPDLCKLLQSPNVMPNKTSTLPQYDVHTVVCTMLNQGCCKTCTAISKMIPCPSIVITDVRKIF